jgi:hypothetical protein
MPEGMPLDELALRILIGAETGLVPDLGGWTRLRRESTVGPQPAVLVTTRARQAAGGGGTMGPRNRIGLVLALLAMTGGTLHQPPASAAVTCDLAGSELFVYMDADGDSARVERDGAAIEINGAPCEGATRFNTLDLTFKMPSCCVAGWDLRVVISLRGGPFSPGSQIEPTPDDDIEFWTYLDDDVYSGGDEMVVQGGRDNDRIRMGRFDAAGFLTNVMNLNVDESPNGGDWDVIDTDAGWDIVRVSGGPGRDRLSGAGGAGTGGRFALPVTILGGLGADRLTGGKQGDDLKGGRGDDVLRGGPGPDLLNGGPGNDTCHGGLGADVLVNC